MDILVQTPIQLILFFILYGITGVVPLIAALYLLLRRTNAIAPGHRLRKATGRRRNVGNQRDPPSTSGRHQVCGLSPLSPRLSYRCHRRYQTNRKEKEIATQLSHVFNNHELRELHELSYAQQKIRKICIICG